jgi:hypothetical protein
VIAKVKVGIEGEKQGLGYQHGWRVGRDQNEEDDLWNCF